MDIFECIERHDTELLLQLLSEGASPNDSLADVPAWVPLKQAIEEISSGGPLESVALLIRWGANVNGGVDPGNATPLLVAAINRQNEAALLLLSAGADPNIRDDEGESPHSVAAKNQDRYLERLLRLFA